MTCIGRPGPIAVPSPRIATYPMRAKMLGKKGIVIENKRAFARTNHAYGPAAISAGEGEVNVRFREFAAATTDCRRHPDIRE